MDEFVELTRRMTKEKCRSREKRKCDNMGAICSANSPSTFHGQMGDKLIIQAPVGDRRRSDGQQPKFASAAKRIHFPEIISAVEGGFTKFGSSMAQEARTTIAGLLVKSRPPPSNLCPAEHKSLKKFNNDETIVIAPADKGSAKVVMDLSDYGRKIRDLLAVSDTYDKLSRTGS